MTDALQRRLDDLCQQVQDTPVEEFRKSTFRQGIMMSWLARMWPKLASGQRDRIAQELAPYFPRIHKARDSIACFHAVASLRQDEDVQRALMWDPKLVSRFKPDPDAELYPTTGWLGSYVEYAKHNHVPTPLHFWVAVGALGSACKRNFYLDRGICRIFPSHQYILLTGKKANGKSTALEIGADMISRANQQMEDEWGDDADLYTINVLPDDFSQTYMLDRLAKMNRARAHKRGGAGEWGVSHSDATGVILCDELSNVLSKRVKVASSRIPFLTTVAFRDSLPYRRGRKNRSEDVIENLALSMIACSAPEWFRNTISAEVLSGGFIDRLTIIFRHPGERIYSKPPPLDPVTAENLARMLAVYCRPSDRPEKFVRQRMELTEDAEKAFGDWYVEHRRAGVRDQNDTTLQSLERKANSVLRLSCLLALSENEMPWVSEERVVAARKILEAEEPFQAEFMGRVGARRDAFVFSKMKQYIADSGGAAQQSKIGNRFFKFKGLGTFARVRVYLDEMERSGELERFDGRRATWWCLPGSNPPEKPSNRGPRRMKYRKGEKG